MIRLLPWALVVLDAIAIAWSVESMRGITRHRRNYTAYLDLAHAYDALGEPERARAARSTARRLRASAK